MIYLDNSATTFPKPDTVYEFMIDFYKNHGVNPGRSGFDAAMEAGEIITDTRKKLTRLFNAGEDYRRLTFSHNATDSLNIILQGLIEKGSHVITTMLEHNSVLRPLYALQQQGICEVTYLPFDASGYVDPGDIAKAVKKNSRLVVCTHCSNVLGTVQPLADIGKICREKGLIFVVDGSQGAGAIPVDMQACNIDVYVFTGHKCLMGPTGTGGSYVRENITVKHTRYGGVGVKSAFPNHLEEYPYRLEAGTLNIMGIAGLNAGIRWIEQQGMENLHHKEMTLWKQLRDGLAQIEGVKIYPSTETGPRNPVLSFNIEGFEAADAGTILDVDYEIACRTGLHCAPMVHKHIGTFDQHGAIRFSLGPFNTEQDVSHATNAVKDISAMRKK
ncbi:MAG: aminotransferase class V-fold PLP-dependent enzyme [Bacteroidales bacterium]|jgi:cysteine desulfurase family protein|nr:aminotransferase class V-fold PLP-dependent enzyme [Bacteroidales bacterium]